MNLNLKVLHSSYLATEISFQQTYFLSNEFNAWLYSEKIKTNNIVFSKD